MSWTTRRIARRAHRCNTCRHSIGRGHAYLLHTLPPGGELGYIGWATFRQCRGCAEGHGRQVELAPIERSCPTCGAGPDWLCWDLRRSSRSRQTVQLHQARRAGTPA